MPSPKPNLQADIDLQVAIDESSELYATLPNADQLSQWACVALQQSDSQFDEFELTIRIVEDAESQALNHEYRGKDKPTNVLSFPFEAPPQIELNLLGDLVICASVVAREANEQHKSLHAHWAHMVIHGTLHLQGYDHINDDEAEEMEQIEIDLLKQLGFDNPYLEQE